MCFIRSFNVPHLNKNDDKYHSDDGFNCLFQANDKTRVPDANQTFVCVY